MDDNQLDFSSDTRPGSLWTDNSVRPPDFTCPEYREWYRWRDDPFKILHNLNGPAVIFSDGEARWYEDGFRVKPKK